MLKEFEFNGMETLPRILEFIEASLKNFKIKSKEAVRSELICEEALVKLIEHADFSKNNFINVEVKKFFSDVSIKLKVPGNEFDFFVDNGLAFNEYGDEDTVDAIRNLVLNSFEKKIEYKSTKNFNNVKIKVSRSPYFNLYRMMTALILAVITGFLMRNFMSEEMISLINTNIFEPVRSIFLRGLKMCVIPFMFFSIASCFTQSGNLSGIKRTGLKLVSYTLLTEIIAIFIGTVLVYTLGIGKGMNLSAISISQNSAQNSLSAVKDTFINLMPDNFIRAFVEGDMLQLIVLSLLVGIAAGCSEIKIIDTIFTDITNIFVKITNFFMDFMPVLIFCSVTSIFIKTGTETLFLLMSILGAIILGFIILIVVYCLMIFFIARLNPVTTLKKTSSLLITAFTTSSSTASVPEANKAAQELGISNKIYSFALPIGIFLSRSSMCLNTVMLIFSIANMYGIELGITQIFSIGISTIIAVTAIPGSGIIALSSILASSDVPIDGLSVVVGIYPIMDMFNIAVKMFSIMTLILIIAKSENQIDVEKYKNII